MNFISTMSLLHTRLFPGFDEILQRYYDWDLWLNLAYRGYTGYHVPRVLFTAHFMDNGISSQQESRQQSIAVVRHKWGRKST